MRNVIAVLVFIASLILAVYTGVWVMFIGGIVGTIEAIRADVLSSSDIAINVVKIIFAGFIGWIIVYVGIFLAALISGQLFNKFKRKKR